MLGILRRRGVPALVLTSLIGRLPTAMSALALVRLVVDTGGDYASASALTATFVIAGTIGQPFLGRIIDRAGHRSLVLLLSAVVTTLGFVIAVLTVQGVPAVAFVAVAVAGFSTPPIESTLRSLWPALFRDATQRASAYALDAAAVEVLFIIGPLLTATGIAVFGAQINVLAMAGVGLVGGIAYAARAVVRRPGEVDARVGARADAGADAHVGMSAGAGAGAKPGADDDTSRTVSSAPTRHGTPLSSAPFVRMLILTLTAAIPVGALTLTATAYGSLASNDDFGPVALAANATGALVGALVIARFPLRRPPARAAAPVAVILGALYLPTAAAGAPPVVWIVLAFVAGLSLPPLLTQIFALTPALVQSRHANEANAWVVSVFAVGIAAGTVLGGITVDALGASSGILTTVLVASALAIVGGLQAGWGAVAPRAAASASHPD
ncbi:MFS transporter [Schumannella soli]|uniref:MFS transporter n=1 Tax=Schumannella soli TaxID=2590779 RepID=A0A506XYS9_9MICO|nr:MFS transporter [Schumannella soli]TPW78094.1 MFS transporter [Schumannella soli]